MRDNLYREGFNVIQVPPCPDVAPPLSGHVDLQLFYHDKKLFCHTRIDPDFIKKVSNHVEVIISEIRLKSTYPGDIPFNIACTGKSAFHRLDATDTQAKSYLESAEIKLINVPQGYSKCSTLIVDEKSIITSDKSIHRAAESAGLSSLIIEPGYISLPGYTYGFIGGASGMYDDKVYFTGSLKDHPDNLRILEFIENRFKKAINLSQRKLIDLGSLIILPVID